MGSSPTRPTSYAGTDPLTGREIRFRKTCKTEQAAQIELGRLLAQAAAGRQPDSAVTVAQRGPILDTLYARLMRCGNLACTGKPFTEHRNTPDLRPNPADRRLGWEQAADRVRTTIRSGQVTPGDTLPSVPDLARLQGRKPGLSGTRSWCSPTKGSCTSVTGGRRSQASRPPTSLLRACRSLLRVLAT